MLESFDHSREGGPGGEVSLCGNMDGIGTGLQNGEEEEELSVELPSRSSLSSTCLSLPFGPSPSAEGDQGRPSSSPSIEDPNISGTTSDASSNGVLEEKWDCDYTGCGKYFPKRHELNRHRKYHFKPYICLAPSCRSHNKAFSLKKDLLRHQASHEGDRYLCPHVGCRCAAGGVFAGFPRPDNWRRHLKRQHARQHD